MAVTGTVPNGWRGITMSGSTGMELDGPGLTESLWGAGIHTSIITPIGMRIRTIVAAAAVPFRAVSLTGMRQTMAVAAVSRAFSRLAHCRRITVAGNAEVNRLPGMAADSAAVAILRRIMEVIPIHRRGMAAMEAVKGMAAAKVVNAAVVAKAANAVEAVKGFRVRGVLTRAFLTGALFWTPISTAFECVPALRSPDDPPAGGSGRSSAMMSP